MTKKTRLDIVIPCYNEADNIDQLCDRLIETITALTDFDSRAIFVNDGSRDRTLEVLRLRQAQFSKFVIINLARNFGKEAAIKAGLSHAGADADVVVVMDADLQHPPEIIPDFIEGWRKGYDVVVAKRRSRNTDSLLRRIGTNTFYSIINRMSDIPVENGEGDFRLMTRRVVDALVALQEANLFMKGLYGYVGFKKTTVNFDIPEQTGNASSYSLLGLVSLAVTALVTGTIIPLRISLWSGLVIVILSVIYLVFETLRFLLVEDVVQGFTTILALVTLIGGANLIFVGIVGEYVGRIFIETKRRQQFIIADIYTRSSNNDYVE